MASFFVLGSPSTVSAEGCRGGGLGKQRQAASPEGSWGCQCSHAFYPPFPSGGAWTLRGESCRLKLYLSLGLGRGREELGDVARG